METTGKGFKLQWLIQDGVITQISDRNKKVKVDQQVKVKVDREPIDVKTGDIGKVVRITEPNAGLGYFYDYVLAVKFDHTPVGHYFSLDEIEPL